MSQTPLLDLIHSPADLKALPADQMPVLCGEIRNFLIESVSRTGGHLSSNLGTIELTVALHRALNSPIDKLVFDVGHQCYTHKLLTGRREGFAHLRQLDGLSGFPSPFESEHDAFVAGHGNTSLSVAIGIAQAKKLRGDPGKVVAIVGDGAFTGGMVYEGMNNISVLNNLIVLLNDNKMSISKNVGSVARYLTVLRTSPQYFRAKENLENVLGAIPLIGRGTVQLLQGAKQTLRRQIYHSTMFEEMGFQYIGPVDGHDVIALEELFTNLRHQTAPLFIHAVTVKGKGFTPAEKNPGEFHGVSAFDLEHPKTDPDIAPPASFSTEFGSCLVELAGQQERLCAITAAMKYGTGLQFFYRKYPQRFFDVGMAEQHAVTFAAGLASAGMLPVVGIYSTFLQRAYDQLLNDVRLMKLDVLLAVDRAGLVPGDGETHQGVYDPAFLSQAGVFVVSPANYAELRFWLKKLVLSFEGHGPRAIRYPRGAERPALAALGCSGRPFDWAVRQEGAKTVLVSYGSEAEDAMLAADLLKEQGTPADVCRLVQIHPLPAGLCGELIGYDTILFAEECIGCGGIGEQLSAALLRAGWQGRFLQACVPGEALPHADVATMKQVLGLDAHGLARLIKGESA